jgi:lysophospholipase L1-like esterase
LDPQAAAMKTKLSRVRTILLILLVNLAVIAAALVFIEGLASYALLFREFAYHPLRPLHRHTHHDAELGWVSLPNLDLEDMYGTGVRLRTNGRGFRNPEDIEPARRPDRRRVVCSGDSVTFGQYVDGDQTWCSLLGHLDPVLEPVNMGQVGYGVDQAYLWYRRDAEDLDVDLHLLAFITHDFMRLKYQGYAGFGRPVLEVRDGRLEMTNKPIPKKGYIMPTLTLVVARLDKLRTTEVAGKIRKRLPLRRREVPGEWQVRENDEVRKVLSLMFQEMKQFNLERSRSTALVYLPSVEELRNPGDADLAEWMPFAEAQAAELDLPLFDMVEELGNLPAHEVSGMFRDGYHFTAAGHALVARKLLEGLRADPRSGPSISLD